MDLDNLDSRLLTQMADEGLGSHSFIPDAGFVGTVFVNTMTNLMVTFGVQAMLTLDFDEVGPSWELYVVAFSRTQTIRKPLSSALSSVRTKSCHCD